MMNIEQKVDNECIAEVSLLLIPAEQLKTCELNN